MNLESIWNDLKAKIASPEERAALEQVEALFLDAGKALILAELSGVPVLGPVLRPLADAILSALETKFEHLTDDALKRLAPVLGQVKSALVPAPAPPMPLADSNGASDVWGDKD